METIKITGYVDDQGHLSATVPTSIQPGPVTLLIVPQSQEDEAGIDWMSGVAHEWADELSDPRQDIYTLADGEPVRET